MKVRYKVKINKGISNGSRVIPVSKSVGNFSFRESAYSLGKERFYTVDQIDYSWESKKCVRCYAPTTQQHEVFLLQDLKLYIDENKI